MFLVYFAVLIALAVSLLTPFWLSCYKIKGKNV